MKFKSRFACPISSPRKVCVESSSYFPSGCCTLDQQFKCNTSDKVSFVLAINKDCGVGYNFVSASYSNVTLSSCVGSDGNAIINANVDSKSYSVNIKIF